MATYKTILALMCLACCSAILFNWPRITPVDTSRTGVVMIIVIISCTMAIIKAIEQGKKN